MRVRIPICLCGAFMNDESHNRHCPYPCTLTSEDIVPEWKRLRDERIYLEHEAVSAKYAADHKNMGC